MVEDWHWLVDWSRIGILVREFSRTGGLGRDWSWIGGLVKSCIGLFLDWSKIVRLVRDWNKIGGLVMYCQINDELVDCCMIDIGLVDWQIDI